MRDRVIVHNNTNVWQKFGMNKSLSTVILQAQVNPPEIKNYIKKIQATFGITLFLCLLFLNGQMDLHVC
jgi:hypothetical protein